MPASNVRKINGVEITGTPSVGDVPVATSATAAAWDAPTAPDLSSAVILAPTSAGRNTIVEGGASVPHLILKASSAFSPVTNMQEWQDSAGQYLVRVAYPGVEPVMEVRGDLAGANILAFKAVANGVDPAVLGTNTDTGPGVQGTNTGTGAGVNGKSTAGISGLFQSSDSANTAPTLVAKAIASQTSNLLECQDSAGAFSAYVDAAGVPHGFGGGQTTYDAIISASGDDYTTVGAAVAAGKYRLFVRDGTYTETGFNLPDNTLFTLHGESTEGVVLNFTGGSVTSYTIYGQANAGIASWDIRNITIKLSYATTAAAYVYGYGLTNSLVSSCKVIYNSATSTKAFVHLQTSSAYYSPSPRNTVFGCSFTVSGINASTCYMLRIEGWDAVHNSFYQDATGEYHGIFMAGYRMLVLGNMFYGTRYGVNSSATSSSIVENFMEGITTKTYYCIYSSGTGCVISGNVMRNAGQANYVVYVSGGYSVISNNTFSTISNIRALYLSPTADNSAVSGNILYNGGSNPALELASGCDKVSIIGNNLMQTTTPLTDGGKGTIVQGNAGINDYIRSLNNAQWTHGQASELLTLSTAGATTDTTANLLPANSVIESVDVRVTTTITTATDWSVGDGTTAARFAAANATMTAGATSVGLQHLQGSVATDAAGPVQTAAAKVRITTTGTPGAGAVRITVFYKSYTAPTS